MKAIQIISQDVFDKIRSRFQNLEMGDETGAVTIDPGMARFFDFDFVNEGNNLGRVSISLNDLGSLKIYYSQGITENQDDPAKQIWYNFLKEMRMFAMRRLLRFDTRDIAKTNLDKNDFQHLAATQGPKEEPEMTTTMNESNKKQRVSESMHIGQQMAQDGITYSPEKEDEIINMMADYMKKSGMSSKAIRYYLSYDEDYISDQLGYLPREGESGLNESRWNHKSTKKTSRAVQGKTEVIVRHAKAVDEEYAGSRSQRKNIKAIFIQNSEGERFKYPFIHPAGAFAMAQHVDHGGIPHDPAGKAIIKMSEQIAQLQEFQRKVQRTSLHDDATGITERAVGRLQELKAQIDSLGKRHHYECWMGEFNEQEHMDNDIMELDAVTMEQYKQTFTQSSFQEELAGYFPLLHRIMSEANKVDLEDYVKEEETDAVEETDSEVKESAFDQFESWAEAVEQGKLTDDEIQALKQALADQPELELTTAYNFFNEFGVDDSDLEDKFRQAANLDSSTDPMAVFQLWAQENYPELLVALGMSGTQAPAEPAPVAPEQPVAEGSGRMINGKEIDMRSLEIDGVDPRDYPDFSDAYISHASFTDGTDLSDEEMDQLNDEHGDLVYDLAYDSLHENTDMVPPPGAMEEGEKEGKGSMVQEVAKIVKSFYNRDNPAVGPFRGEEGIVIDVEKQISEKFGDDAGQQAGKMAEAFMQKLTQEWQQKHGGNNLMGETDPLDRLKELLGNVKAKVEGIGDQGQGGRDFNKNIMPAEDKDADDWHPSKHIADPQKKKELAPHDKDVERGSYNDRARYMKAGGVPDDRGPNENGPDKSEIPAFKRKEQGGDWKMSTKDLEKEKTNSPTSSAGLARQKAELGIREELASIMRLANHKK